MGRPKHVTIRREPIAERLVITDSDLDNGMQRAVELAMSECMVAFQVILGENEAKIPAGHAVQFSVNLVPVAVPRY